MRKMFTLFLRGNSLRGFYDEIIDITLRRNLSLYDELAKKYMLRRTFNDEIAFVVISS